MSVPYLGGAGENLSGLNVLVDSIGSMINPDAKFQSQIRMAFLEKPELMQKFVDIEKANPGTLKAFGFGDKGANLLGKMQESIPGLQARLLAPQIAEELQKPSGQIAKTAVSKATTGQTPGELAQDDFSGWFAKEGQKLLESDPQMFVRAARSKFGTGSKIQNVQEDAAVEAYNNAQPLRDMAPMDVVNQIAAGKLKANDVGGLLVGPESEAVGIAMKLYMDERESRTRMFLARYGRSQDDTIARTKLAAAIDAWQASKGKGSLGGWYTHLWGENTFGGPAAGDQEVIAGALKDQQFDQRTQQLTRMFKSVEPLISAIHKGGAESEQQNRISRINDVLKTNNSDWEAFWDEEGIFNFGRLGFRNKAGDVTADPSVITSEIPPPSVVNGDQLLQSRLTPPQQALVGQLKGLTGEARKARIGQIRARAGNSQIAETIIRLAGGE